MHGIESRLRATLNKLYPNGYKVNLVRNTSPTGKGFFGIRYVLPDGMVGYIQELNGMNMGEVESCFITLGATYTAIVKLEQPIEEVKFAPIGTVIHGTGVMKDITHAFIKKLIELDRINADNNWDAWKWLYGKNDVPFYFSDASSENMDEEVELFDHLVESLQEHAMPYCYFGTLEGDASDYGFWPSQIEDDDGDVHVGNVGPPSFWLHTNDHGNQTLYRISAEEVWGMV